MCGIAAVFKLDQTECAASVVEAMRDAATHRGPDDQGVQFFHRMNGALRPALSLRPEEWAVGLGHRRLSILDLSAAARQPMSYRGRYWIVYNGEVYNYVELRRELETLGHVFRTTSDTEVILAAYAQWGPKCFSRFRGMWGIVLVDLERHEAVLSRDRLGMKPLYTWRRDGLVAVASEIKQLLKVPGFRPQVDPMAGAEYLLTGYEDQARTFFVDVQPVPPGTWYRISLDTLGASAPEAFWHPERIQATISDEREAARAFGEKFTECVRLHLRSDVPVGCALSGGLDSSSIAVLVHALNSHGRDPLNTFTSVFPGEPIDESEFVEVVLDAIRAVPHYVRPDPKECLEDLDRFVWIHDEPVGHLSQYAGYCVARKTREAGVPVTLNGQGGDELFSGYWQCYFMHLRELGRRGHFLSLGEHFVGALLRRGNPTLWDQIPVMWRRYRAREVPPLLRLRGPLIGQSGRLLRGIMELHGQTRRVYDIRSMILPRLLKWEDRNSMAFSVEGRYPFLDHELIELCLSFVSETLYHRGWTKWPLRLGLEGELPEKIRWRRTKFSFETPQGKWLVDAFRSVLERWLEDEERPVWGFVEREDVRRVAHETWQSQGKRKEVAQMLFRIFVFNRWLEIFGLSA